MSKRILVTGGAGFIGSNLVKYHLDAGDFVWAVDNLRTGRVENILPFMTSSSFRFDRADLRDWGELVQAVQSVDRIYHMAATVGQRLVLDNPIETLSNNIEGCEKILNAMGNNTHIQLLIASTAEVYNYITQDAPTFKEDLMLNIPSGKEQLLQESYPLSKMVEEAMGMAYLTEKGIKCTIARIFNTIGLNQCARYGMVVPNFIEQALDNMPITVHDDGMQTRSFCNVHDTVKALDMIMDNPECNGEVINVGNDRETTILDLAMLIKAKTHSSSPIVHIPYEVSFGKKVKDLPRRCPNLEKLRYLTGFKHQWTLEDTILEIIDHVKMHGRALF